jgi:hypothetical protein
MVPTAQAAEWSITGTLNPSAKYDDNVFMSENETSSFQYSVSPTAIFSRKQDNNNATLNLGYDISRYRSLSSLDRQNPFVRFSSGYQTERSDWGLGAGYVKNSSRNSAVEDTGDFQTESTATTKTLSPSYQYKLTERDNVSLGGSYSKKTFSTTDFSDNKTLSLNTGWTRQFSERMSGGLNFSVSNSQSTGLLVSTDYDNYNLSTSLNYDLSELWQISGSIGVRRLNSEQMSNGGNTVENSSSGLSLDINANRKTEIGALSVGLSRSVSPSSTGDVNETDRLTFSWSRNLTERVSTSLTTSYQQTSSALENTTEKRENISFSPAISWQLERNLGLNLAYNYRQQKQSQLNSNVSSNALILSLNYDWDGLRASR